jgi:hypothetical protein
VLDLLLVARELDLEDAQAREDRRNRGYELGRDCFLRKPNERTRAAVRNPQPERLHHAAHVVDQIRPNATALELPDVEPT